MGWLAARAEQRSHPRALWQDARTVIALGLTYAPLDDPLAPLVMVDRGTISTYARGRDYHDLMKGRLKHLAAFVTSRFGAEVKVFVDTAPVMEKPLGEAAGLGWIGKHTNLIARDAGSWFFVGEVFTDLPLLPDTPAGAHCGSCSACIPACPTGAIVAPYQLDARRCISYLTIELEGSIAPALRPALGNRIYGCDDCQLVCPWNKFARDASHPDFRVRHALDSPRLTELFGWSAESFEQRMRGSAIHRIGYERWLRNIAVALGNASTSAAVLAALEARCEHPSALLREHVAWALRQHRDRAAAHRS